MSSVISMLLPELVRCLPFELRYSVFLYFMLILFENAKRGQASPIRSRNSCIVGIKRETGIISSS